MQNKFIWGSAKRVSKVSPITFYYTDEEGHGEAQKPAKRYRCFIGDLGKAWAGKDIYFELFSSNALTLP